MNKIHTIFLLAIIVIALAFFKMPVFQNAHFKDDEKIIFWEYDRENENPRKIVFPPGSSFHKLVNEWLATNSFWWNHSFNTYGGGITIYSKGVHIVIFDHFVVINYAQFSDKVHTQVVREIDVKEFKNVLLQHSL